jgi:hypothetical protein
MKPPTVRPKFVSVGPGQKQLDVIGEPATRLASS